MKNLMHLTFLVFLAAACSTEPHYVVTGKISGADSVTFLLQKRDAGQIVTIDSALASNGSFRMKGGAVKYPEMVMLTARDTRMRTSFYLENSDITITGTLDSLFNATVTGSKTQDEYQGFVNDNKALNDRYSKVFNEYQTATQSGDTARVSQLEKDADGIVKEMIELQKNFIKNNPASFASPSILRSLSYEIEGAEIEAFLNAMDTAVANTPVARELKEKVALMKTVAIGQKAPDFSLNDPDGNLVSLSSKVGAKLLLVDFWAAWCGPCRRENPNVVKVYNEFHKKGFDILGVSLDQKKEDWVKAIADDKLTWTHVSDLQYWNSAAAKLYAVSAIPANFLLDENGIIVAKNLREGALYDKVKEVLGE